MNAGARIRGWLGFVQFFKVSFDAVADRSLVV